MYLYWRIQQDLHCLGETLYFHDPAFIRPLHKWVKKNYHSLVMIEGHQNGQNIHPPDIFLCQTPN